MDAIKILGAFIPMAILWGPVSKLWDWFFMWLSIALIVGGWEIVSVFGNGHPLAWVAIVSFPPLIGFMMWLVGRIGHDFKTISRQFWIFFKDNFWIGLADLASAGAFFFYFVVLHLGLKW